jgi:hypothetical protein
MVVIAGRERLVLRPVRSKRSPADLRQRRRATQRRRRTVAERKRARLVSSARTAADRRLRNLFPELFEVILADERSKAGLDDFTLDRCLHGNPLSSSLDELANYSHLEVPG